MRVMEEKMNLLNGICEHFSGHFDQIASYGISDLPNPLIRMWGLIPKFNLQKNGVHNGHVQVGLQDNVRYISTIHV